MHAVRKWGNSMLGISVNLTWKGLAQREAKAVTVTEVAVTQERGCVVFFVVELFTHLPVFRHDHEWSCFGLDLSWPQSGSSHVDVP